MLLAIPDVLAPEALARARELLFAADWADGRITAGSQSAQVKNNLQLAESCPALPELRQIVMDGLSRNGIFFSAALPQRILPPLFNCYRDDSNFFGNHVDNPIRNPAGSAEQVRTDLSATLFFCEPEEYEGGELVIEDSFGCQRIKLPAGHMVLYPSSSVHRVEPVTRGARYASFMWLQSLIRQPERRRLLFDMDMSLLALRQREHGNDDSAEVVRLTACYHNLLRMWAEP